MQAQKINFSEKQKEVWKHTVGERHRWNVSCGATRSGKTYLDYYKIPKRIRSAGNDGLILLLGNTKGTLERNILDPLRGIWGDNFVGHIGSNNKLRLFGRECYALGADKINQVSKLQGAGLSYCYGDEVTTWNADVFQMLKSRLDKPDSCFDGTCNPAAPNHWFKEFLNSNADIYQMHFTIDDNPFLVPAFVDNLKKEYAGTIFYDRFILGKWVAAQGIIYRLFADTPEAFIIDEVPAGLMLASVGVDFGGNQSAHAFVCNGITSRLREVVTLEEYYRKEIISAAELENDFVDFIKKCQGKYRVAEVYCDSAEQVLIQGLKNAAWRAGLRVDIKNALKGEITGRIRFFNSLMGQGRYKIMRHCKHTIAALQNAVWDSKSVEDRRLDDGSGNVDSLDALEYASEKYMKDIMQSIWG